MDLSAPLFVPGDRPDRVVKARDRGARAVIIDLEDAVPSAEKDAARAGAVEALDQSHQGVAHLVRINPVSSQDLVEADLAALGASLRTVAAVVVPKVQSAAEVECIVALLADAAGGPVPVIATIESARGVRAAWDIAAASSSLVTLLLGCVDLTAELGLTATPEGAELIVARSTVVLACAAAGLRKPIDGPHLTITDAPGLTTSTMAARSLGYGGKIAIHPDQLPVIRAALAPSADQVNWATRVVAAYAEALSRGRGVVRMVDGTFIDAPVAVQARTILASTGAIGGNDS